jgi:hypothetical protein
MTISILGVDMGKNSCSVIGVGDRGAVIVCQTMRQQTLIEFVSKSVAAFTTLVGLSSRKDTKSGLHRQSNVRPYVKGADEGRRKGSLKPGRTMRFLGINSEEQLDVPRLDRVRSRLVAQRTTLTNETRPPIWRMVRSLPQVVVNLRMRSTFFWAARRAVCHTISMSTVNVKILTATFTGARRPRHRTSCARTDIRSRRHPCRAE